MIKRILLVFSILLLVGCSNKYQEKVITEYYITIDDNDIKVNNLFDYVKMFLGKYEEYKEDNEKYIYSYDGIDIETYDDNNSEKILSYWLTSDKYKTNEGIRIGDNIEEAIYRYGKIYDYNNSIYTYKLNNSSLSFIEDNGIIRGIEYSLIR